MRNDSAKTDSTASVPKKGMLLEKLTRAFVALNVMDLVMTFFLLNNGGFRESNKIADYFLDRWGIVGMVWYKIIFVMVIVMIAQVVAHKRLETARGLLIFGCVAVGAVVLYSAYLYFTFTGNAAPIATISMASAYL